MFVVLFIFLGSYVGAINNKDKYGWARGSRVVLLTVRVHEKTASDDSGRYLLLFITLGEMLTVPRYYK